MKTPYAYYGGKSRMAELLVGCMPPHTTYVEPFFGSGAVFFARPRSNHEIINDLDRNIVTFLRVLRDRRDELEMACALTPHARDEFRAADLTGELDDLERARRTWVRLNQSFGKTLSGRTGWSWTTARNTSIPSTIASRLGRFAGVADRLMGATIESKPAAELLSNLNTGPEALWYLDPPYLHSTRVQADGYEHEMTHDDHTELAAVCRDTDSTVIVSGYASPEYAEWFDGWFSTSLEVIGYSSNARTHHRAVRTEVLWSNRDIFTPANTQMELGA